MANNPKDREQQPGGPDTSGHRPGQGARQPDQSGTKGSTGSQGTSGKPDTKPDMGKKKDDMERGGGKTSH
jgi:hypothetical protein